MKKIHLVEDLAALIPPEIDIPKHWIICNAPRPIIGTTMWQGDFRHGRFYAAIDPDNEFAGMNMGDNDRLDAWELVFVTLDQAKEKIRETYPQYAHNIEKLGERKIIETFRAIMNRTKNKGD